MTLSNKLVILVVSSVLLGSIFTFSTASAQISPGKLSSYHEALEGIKNCIQCHQLGEAVTNQKCLDCHHLLRSNIAENRGFHASRKVETEQCADCHQEHNGRDYELVYWPDGQDNFDHSLTGYVIEGAHKGLACQRCHQKRFRNSVQLSSDASINPGRTFLGLDHNCLSCHVDEHRQQLTDNCLDCHSYQAWQPADKFNHSTARYQLTGKHLETGCEKCHPYQVAEGEISKDLIGKSERQGLVALYQGLAFSSCNDCHQDVHQGRLGVNCSGCHSTEGFKTTVNGGKFSHDKTDFPLFGKHIAVECYKCHKSGKLTDPLDYEFCSNCHVDPHQGQFQNRADGGLCESCHTVEGFIPSTFGIETHQQGSYSLTGSHLAVPCIACHIRTTDEAGNLVTQFDLKHDDCASCHEDIHQGQLKIWQEKGGCAYCHNTDTWHRTSFDHQLARFKLDGKHREILCLKCHQIETEEGGRQVWMKPLDMTCAGCHDDVHRGQFIEQGNSAAECEKCHHTAGWNQLSFDHNRDSQFALDGAHRKLPCNDCHKPAMIAGQTAVRYRPLGKECIDCHRKTEHSGN